jgi:outer membrane protein
MKRFGSIVAAALFFAATAFAQTTPSPTAVGLINFQRALAQNDEGVKAGNAYTEEGKRLQAELTKYQTKVTELQDKLTKSGPTMSDTDRNALTRDIEKAKKDMEREQEDAQMAIDEKQDELFRPIADRVHKIVEGYAKELNLVLVLNISDDMLYASDVVDITTEIIRRTNADIVKNPATKKP